MSQYFKSARAQGISDDQIILNLQEKGWKDEDIKRGLAASTPQLTQNSQSKYRSLRIVIAPAFTLIMFALIGYIGFQIFVDKTIETMSKNDIVAGGEIKIDPITEDQNIVTYTHPSGKFSFEYPDGASIKDGSDIADPNQHTFDIEKFQKETGYMTIVNDVISISILDTNTVRSEMLANVPTSQCANTSFIDCIVENVYDARESKAEIYVEPGGIEKSVPSVERMNIGDHDVALMKSWTSGKSMSGAGKRDYFWYMFMTDDQAEIVFIILRPEDDKLKVTSDSVKLVENIIRTFKLETNIE